MIDILEFGHLLLIPLFGKKRKKEYTFEASLQHMESLLNPQARRCSIISEDSTTKKRRLSIRVLGNTHCEWPERRRFETQDIVSWLVRGLAWLVGVQEKELRDIYLALLDHHQTEQLKRKPGSFKITRHMLTSQ